MPSHAITHCAGHNGFHLCSTCWRRLCPVPEGVKVPNALWTPNRRGRGWCEGYVEGEDGKLGGEMKD